MDAIGKPDALALALDAILNDRLAILAGAGLSMAAPSGLPSAWSLAQAAKQKYDATYGTTRAPLSDDIEEQAEFFLANGELESVYLTNYIDRNAFAGPPNAGHIAIADLLLSGGIDTAVTTNVDGLVENAAQPLLGRIGVGLDGHQMAVNPQGAAPLLKVHGCWGIDYRTTVWTAAQLAMPPIRERIERSAAWLGPRLLNKDLVIVGFSTDWDYLNAVLSAALGATNPERVLVVDPTPGIEFAAKAPHLHAIGGRARNGFFHLQGSGADFLDALRLEHSRTFVRQVLASGSGGYLQRKGSAAPPDALEPPDIGNDEYWHMRRDLLGCLPNQPAERSRPHAVPLLGTTLLQLRAAGATSDGSYWSLGGRTVRVINTPPELLHSVEAKYRGETPPVSAADFVIAVGAESSPLPPSIVRPGGSSIARGGAGRWLTRTEAERELAI